MSPSIERLTIPFTRGLCAITAGEHAGSAARNAWIAGVASHRLLTPRASLDHVLVLFLLEAAGMEAIVISRYEPLCWATEHANHLPLLIARLHLGDRIVLRLES